MYPNETNTFYKCAPISVLIFFNAQTAFLSGYQVSLYGLQGLTAVCTSSFHQPLCLIYLHAKTESYWLHSVCKNRLFLYGSPNKYNSILHTLLIGQNSTGWLLSGTIFSLQIEFMAIFSLPIKEIKKQEVTFNLLATEIKIEKFLFSYLNNLNNFIILIHIS